MAKCWQRLNVRSSGAQWGKYGKTSVACTTPIFPTERSGWFGNECSYLGSARTFKVARAPPCFTHDERAKFSKTGQKNDLERKSKRGSLRPFGDLAAATWHHDAPNMALSSQDTCTLSNHPSPFSYVHAGKPIGIIPCSWQNGCIFLPSCNRS